MPVSDQVLRSLDGLSVGDAFGQCFFSIFHHLPRAGETRKLPAPPWMWTDDTMMACGIVEVLDRHGFIGIPAQSQLLSRRRSQPATRASTPRGSCARCLISFSTIRLPAKRATASRAVELARPS